MNKKWIQKLMLVLCSGFLFCFVSNVKAASGSVSVNLSKQNIVVGTTIQATVTISSGSTLGSWQAVLNYDSSKLQFISSTADGQTMLGVGDGKTKNKTYTFTFKAIASGTASVNIASASILDWDTDAPMSVSRGSASVKIITQQELEASYSKNNYLSSLGIEGASLSPEFNKDTLEYSIEFEPETTKMVINGAIEDRTASVTGLGEVQLSEGANRFEIKVTAQNGNVRTYIINATVKEYNPIQVTVGDKSYTVVRKKGDLQAPNNYTETTIKINNEDVPAFHSEITNITLVGLKNESGEIALYRYENDIYSPYIELNFNRVILLEETPDKESIPAGFLKKTTKLGDREVTVYFHEKSGITLLYGMNVETGKSHFYTYEEQENTLQIFDETIMKSFGSDVNFKLVLILGSTTLLFFVSTIVFVVLLNKGKKTKIKKEDEL